MKKEATINDGGPAFPGQWYDFQPLTGEQVVREQWGGMSLRQYAAIHLRVPDSGVDWMDEMIRKAQRDDLAAKAMAAFIAEPVSERGSRTVGHWANQLQGHAQMSGPDIVAHVAYMMADAMLRAREQQPRESVNAELLDAAKIARDALAAAIKAAWEGSTDADVAERAIIKKLDSTIARATGQEG